jgi:hypothetical protein
MPSIDSGPEHNVTVKGADGDDISLDGCWHSSLGASVVCRGKTVTFDGSVSMQLIVQDSGCVSIDGWQLAAARSSASRLRWHTKTEGSARKCYWEFEDSLADRDAVVGLGQRRGGVVQAEKRKRTKVDYVAMDRRMRGKSSSSAGGATSGGGEVRQFVPGQKNRPNTASSTATVALLADSGAGRSALRGEDLDEDVTESSLQDLADIEDADAVKEVAAELSSVAAAGGAVAGKTLLGMLVKLERFPMDLPTLQHSGVAKAVKPLRKHEETEVAALAKRLFDLWKAVAIKSGAS